MSGVQFSVADGVGHLRLTRPEVSNSIDLPTAHELQAAVGQPRALELFLTGRVLSADEALAWGLVNEVVDDEAVADRAAELAARMAAGPAYALGQAKRLARAAWTTTRAKAGAEETATIMRAATTDEAQALIAAFTKRA